MHDLASANVDRYVTDTAAVRIEHQISRLQIIHRYGGTANLSRCAVRQADTKVCKYRHGKSGTVCTICQAGASPDVRISNKLYRIVRNLLTK